MHICNADFSGRNDDDENDDCSDNSNRSSDPFEFLIRPLMFSFSNATFATLHWPDATFATLHWPNATFVGRETIRDLLRPTDST